MEGSDSMAKTIAIGRQDFERMRTRNVFYIDKTDFIREWWEAEALRCPSRPPHGAGCQ